MNLETTIMRDDGKGGEVEIPVRVEFDYHRAIRGQRDSLCGKRGAGPPLEPDEPAFCEVGQVFVIGEDGQIGPEVDDITPEETSRIEDECMAEVADRANDYPEDDDR